MTKEEIEKFKNELALYSQDLINVLNSTDLEQYRNFVEKWYEKRIIDEKTYMAYKNGSEKEVFNSYCHLILGFKGDKISEHAKEWAKMNMIKDNNNA